MSLQPKMLHFVCPPVQEMAYVARSQLNEQCCPQAIEGTRTTLQGFPFSMIQQRGAGWGRRATILGWQRADALEPLLDESGIIT